MAASSSHAWCPSTLLSTGSHQSAAATLVASASHPARAAGIAAEVTTPMLWWVDHNQRVVTAPFHFHVGFPTMRPRCCVSDSDVTRSSPAARRWSTSASVYPPHTDDAAPWRAWGQVCLGALAQRAVCHLPRAGVRASSAAIVGRHGIGSSAYCSRTLLY